MVVPSDLWDMDFVTMFSIHQYRVGCLGSWY